MKKIKHVNDEVVVTENPQTSDDWSRNRDDGKKTLLRWTGKKILVPETEVTMETKPTAVEDKGKNTKT